MYDPLKLCTTEEHNGQTRYVAEPGKVIPPTLGRIEEVLQTKWQVKLPDELVNMNDDDPSIAAKGVVREVAGLIVANQPYTAAWAWFKRALALKVGKGYLLRITRDEKYKEQ